MTWGGGLVIPRPWVWILILLYIDSEVQLSKCLAEDIKQHRDTPLAASWKLPILKFLSGRDHNHSVFTMKYIHQSTWQTCGKVFVCQVVAVVMDTHSVPSWSFAVLSQPHLFAPLCNPAVWDRPSQPAPWQGFWRRRLSYDEVWSFWHSVVCGQTTASHTYYMIV